MAMFTEINLQNVEKVEEKEVYVLSDDTQTFCPICKEKFEKVYINDEFRYKGAIIDPRSNMITHKGCVFEEGPAKKKKFE
jgi:hypothetical protein